MADNSVFITGAATGAFTDALADLPPWATEDTAHKIEKLLKKSLDVQTKALTKMVKGAGGGQSPEQMKKLNDQLDKYLKSLAKQNQDEEKRKKRQKQAEEEADRALIHGKKLKTTNEKVLFVLAGLAAAGSAVLKAEKQYLKTSSELYKAGVNVLNGNNSTADGFVALNQTVLLTGLRLETLQEIAEKYSNSINAIGFTKFVKTTAMASARLSEFGYSAKETAELIGVYSESMQGYTDIRNRSEKDLADEAVRLGAQMGRLSQMVGMSRAQMQENLKLNAKSTDASFILAAKGEQAAKNIELFTASFKDQNVGKFFEMMSAASDPVYTKGFQDLQKAGLGDIAAQFAQISKNAENMGPEAARKQLDDFMKTLSPSRLSNLRDQVAAQADGAKEAADLFSGLARETRNTSTATESQKEAATKTAASTAKLETEIERLSATLQAAFTPLISQVNTLASSMKVLNDATYGLAGSIDVGARSAVGAGIIIAGLAAAALGIFGKISTFMSIFGGGSAAAGAGGAAAGAGGAGGAAGGAAAGGVAGAALGLAALPVAVAGAGMYLQSEMASPEGRKRRAAEQQKRIAEKQEILKAYKESGASAAAINKIEKEIAQQEALVADLSAPQSSVAATTQPSSSPIVSNTNVTSQTVTNSATSSKGAATDINSSLATQNALLDQISQSLGTLISVNKDILRYAKVNQ